MPPELTNIEARALAALRRALEERKQILSDTDWFDYVRGAQIQMGEAQARQYVALPPEWSGGDSWVNGPGGTIKLHWEQDRAPRPWFLSINRHDGNDSEISDQFGTKAEAEAYAHGYCRGWNIRDQQEED